MSEQQSFALVTGCSTGGIGPALALYLQREAGFTVFATARKISNMPEELAAAGCKLLELDVTKEDSLKQVQEQVAAITGGRLNLLINNAGQGGSHIPTLDVDLDAARELMDVNFIGTLASCQTFAPMMVQTAKSGTGDCRATILNAGSLVGTRGFPLRGIYSAAKSSIHALSDSLRTELAPMGITVSCSITGGVKSQVGPKAKDLTKRNGKKDTGLFDHIKDAIAQNVMGMRERQVKNSVTPEDYAASILPSVLSPHPPAFVYGGSHVNLAKYLFPITPAWVTDKAILRQQGFEGLITYKRPEQQINHRE